MTRIDHSNSISLHSRNSNSTEWPEYTGGQSFGTLISEYRKRAKLEVKDLARRTKLSTLAVVKIENGTRMPTSKSVDALIRALELSEVEEAMLKECSRANQQFGTVIKMERERRGLSMRDIAYDVGLSHGALQKIEGGLIQPTISTVLRIADALKLDEWTWGQFLSHFMKKSDYGTIEEQVVLEIIRQAGIDAVINTDFNKLRINLKLGLKVRVALSVEKL
jgi:transcriptional regulator with XRE-family HTH domain